MLAVGPLLGLLFQATGGTAQAVRGTVLDATTSAAVPSAAVVLLDSVGRQLGRVTTDQNGSFLLHLGASGQVRVRVDHTAYASYVSPSRALGASETLTLEVRLEPRALALDSVVVRAQGRSHVAGFHRRRAINAFGHFISRDEIDRRSPPRTTELVRGVAGLAVVSVPFRGRTYNVIAVRGGQTRCQPAIYVDGVPFEQQVPHSTLDELLAPAMLEGVEVYTTSSNAPAEFIDPAGCGVVLFWTRSGENTTGARIGWRGALIGLAAAVTVIILIR
jgi:carboxypeptidase family protein/TonB-dependent receptor-like protein